MSGMVMRSSPESSARDYLRYYPVPSHRASSPLPMRRMSFQRPPFHGADSCRTCGLALHSLSHTLSLQKRGELLAILRSLVALIGLLTAILPTPASALSLTDRVVLQSADPDPYAADPLGLVAYYELTSYRGTAPDRFEVWVCDGVHGSLDLTPENVTGLLNAELPPYFSWLSEGQYALSFLPGGSVRANNQQDCLASVSNRSTGVNHAAIVVSTLHIDNASNVWSWGGPGSYCWDGVAIEWCNEFYPDNGRQVWMGWFTNVGSQWSPIALSSIENGIGSLDNLYALGLIKSVAHEVGHTLSWPHSFSGETVNDDGTVDEYDNPMDVMSEGPTARYEDNRGWSSRSVLAGTHVLNRYAAGWVHPNQIAFHHWDHLSLHAIGPVGTQATQMVILGYSPGVFEAIGVRVQKSYDSVIPKEGVEIYLIDQSSAQCERPYKGVCWGLDRRTKPALSEEDDPVLHVLGLGEGVYWGASQDDPDGYELNVIERYGDTFIIEIAPGDDYTAFIDVPYEDFFFIPVRWAQSLDITTGIGKGRFGIQSGLKREEMITFLCRAYAPAECSKDQFNGSAYFADVPEDHWANTTIGWAFENNITSGIGNGLFGIGRTLTREQTVTFLHRAEGTPTPGTLGEDHYDDVPGNADAWYQAPIGWAYDQGITGGTAARTFGFQSTPSREETMLFMCRTLDPAICPPSKEPVASTTRGG